MANIEYSGIAPDSYELLSSEAFQSLLQNNPNLRLVTISEDEDTDEEIFTDINFPLTSEHDDYVALMDTSNDDQFMWVLYDDFATVEDPSPALIEALIIMDAFLTGTREERLFLDVQDMLGETAEFYGDDPKIIEADFDFTSGRYIV